MVQKVFEHEQAMRYQAKKMNVTSLRADDDGGTRAEIKIAKVRAFFELPMVLDEYLQNIFLTENFQVWLCFIAKKNKQGKPTKKGYYRNSEIISL